MAHKHKKYLLILLIAPMLVFLTLAIAIYILTTPPSASRAFRRFVCDPIPKSVKEIKMDRHVPLRGFLGKHRYLFHFSIDEADLSLILNSRPFKEVQSIKYNDKNGILSWGDEPTIITGYTDSVTSHTSVKQRGLSLLLYNVHSEERAPEWFSLEQWANPKVYVFEQREVIRIRILVYHKNLGEAYFVDWRGPD